MQVSTLALLLSAVRSGQLFNFSIHKTGTPISYRLNNIHINKVRQLITSLGRGKRLRLPGLLRPHLNSTGNLGPGAKKGARPECLQSWVFLWFRVCHLWRQDHAKSFVQWALRFLIFEIGVWAKWLLGPFLPRILRFYKTCTIEGIFLHNTCFWYNFLHVLVGGWRVVAHVGVVICSFSIYWTPSMYQTWC